MLTQACCQKTNYLAAEVYAEQYILSLEVEAKLVIDMATTQIYPAVTQHLTHLADVSQTLSGLSLSLENTDLNEAVEQANGMMSAVKELKVALAEHNFASTEEHMSFSAKTLCPLLLKVREHADTLEGMVADDLWPLPKYQEMLFIK